MDRDDPAFKGQAGYISFLLAIYDPFVLGFMARVVWRCPTLDCNPACTDVQFSAHESA